MLLNVVDDDCAKVRARHVPVEVHLGEGGTRVVVLAGVVVERATKLTGLQEHLTLNVSQPRNNVGPRFYDPEMIFAIEVS